MGDLNTAHTVIITVTTTVAIVVCVGLAVYVATRNPGQSVSRVFSLLCLTIASIYLSSLFMVSRPETSLAILSFPLRWKWVAIAFSSTVYLHLVYLFFPSTWQRYRPWTLIPAYLISTGLALAALFTDLLVAGPQMRLAPHIIAPMPGPLMHLHASFFILEIGGGAVGLFVSYRMAPSPSRRHQIAYLLIPTSLVLLSGAIHWINILSQDLSYIPHELPDALLIVAAFFGARAVVRYGSFAGRPLSRRSLFYSTLMAVTGLSALYLTMALDHWLMLYTPFPYPPATGILVLAVVAGFPSVSRWVTKRLDRWLFLAERQQRELVYHLSEALTESPDPTQLQTELLAALCTILGVRSGHIALATSDGPAEMWLVSAVHGDPSQQPGDLVPRPRMQGREPQLVTTFLLNPPVEPGWQEVALFCPLTIEQDNDGVLALGEKRDGKPFTPSEISLCSELARQLGSIGRMRRLRRQRDSYLEAARLQAEKLRQIGKEVITTTHQTLSAWETWAVPLEIRILGPLQVSRNGRPIPESAWGSEKAKALLAYLLWKSPTGATRVELSRALWPDRSTDDTANVFHVTLHRLRRVLQPERSNGNNRATNYIKHDRGRYRFNPDTPHWLDATAFQELVTGDDTVALRAAVDLYRGAYLEDAAWALPPEVEACQRRYEQLYADTLRRLAARTYTREAMPYLENLLVIEPADEAAHQALVLGYLSRGRGDLARRQIRHWQQVLIEMDLEPSPETLALWERVETKNDQPG